MGNENSNLEQLEAEIVSYHQRIPEAKAPPAYHADPELRKTIEQLEGIAETLDEQAATMHATAPVYWLNSRLYPSYPLLYLSICRIYG